ncbi:MAG: hypothetical protein PHE55_03410 [Methylococcaceae bacterium]|nr:hypothetical protein [Methylococcaceae bacterium]
MDFCSGPVGKGPICLDRAADFSQGLNIRDPVAGPEVQAASHSLGHLASQVSSRGWAVEDREEAEVQADFSRDRGEEDPKCQDRAADSSTLPIPWEAVGCRPVQGLVRRVDLLEGLEAVRRAHRADVEDLET